MQIKDEFTLSSLGIYPKMNTPLPNERTALEYVLERERLFWYKTRFYTVYTFSRFLGWKDINSFILMTTDSLHVNMTEQEVEPLLHLSSQHRYNMGALPLGWHQQHRQETQHSSHSLLILPTKPATVSFNCSNGEFDTCSGTVPSLSCCKPIFCLMWYSLPLRDIRQQVAKSLIQHTAVQQLA